MDITKSQDTENGRYRRYLCVKENSHVVTTQEISTDDFNKLWAVKKAHKRHLDSLQFRLDYLNAKLKELSTVFSYGEKK